MAANSKAMKIIFFNRHGAEAKMSPLFACFTALAFLLAGCSSTHNQSHVRGHPSGEKLLRDYEMQICDYIDGLEYVDKRQARIAELTQRPFPPELQERGKRIRNSICPDEVYFEAVCTFHKTLQMRLDAREAEYNEYVSDQLRH